MTTSFISFITGLLTAALSALGFVQAHPELPQSSRDQVVEVATQAVSQASNVIASSTLKNSSANWRTYTDTARGFSFLYPPNLILDTQKNNFTNDTPTLYVLGASSQYHSCPVKNQTTAAYFGNP